MWLGPLVLVSAWLVTAPAAAEDLLRYRFTEGEKFRYVTEVTTAVEELGAKDPVKIDTGLTVDLTSEVNTLNGDGGAAVTTTLDRVRLTFDRPMGKLSFDSKDGKEPDDEFFKLMTETMKALVGGKVTLTLGPQGKVSDVKLSEQVEKVVIGRPRPNADGLARELVRVMSGQLLPLPERELKKGDPWSAKSDWPSAAGRFTIEQKYVLDGTAERSGRKLEKVAIKQTGAVDEKSLPAGTKVTFDGGEGTAYFDRDAGRLVELSLVGTMTRERTLGGRTIKQKFTIKTTTKLADGAKAKE
jgi:hypothetical protein